MMKMDTLHNAFRTLFGNEEAQFQIFSPYRICPLGAHVDHQHGLVSGFAFNSGIDFLLSETGSLVQTLKPCFLMSPLSVSTFLEADGIRFDTIVFDEASQIFPQDAVGAIYRGKQLIVVGDSRQMPPSNFFAATLETDDADEETGDINDFESILDICSSVFTTERLAWHYRSHYEQLIAFSNLNFYNNKC